MILEKLAFLATTLIIYGVFIYILNKSLER